MGLMAMLEEVLNGRDATVTVATPPTVKPKVSPSVARVADVTVTSDQISQIGRPNLRLMHTVNTEQGATLLARRLQSFQAKGLAHQQAAVLADGLVKRDRQLDDRRSCAECVSFYAGDCLQRITPIGETTVYTLHRCKGFEDEGGSFAKQLHVERDI